MPKPTSLVFEPDSVYLLFISKGCHPCAGVFHHGSRHRGILAYADVGLLTPQRPHRVVLLVEFDLKQSEILPLNSA
jgi:hypothetical protein